MSRRLSGGARTAIIWLIALTLNSPLRAAEGVSAPPPQDANSIKSKPAETDPFRVPDGSIENLQKYIEGLSKLHPSSGLPQAVVELHKKRAAAQLAACEKILSAKPMPDQARAAVRSKVAALKILGRLGDATAQTGLEATLAQVEKLDLKDLVREVRLAALENRCGKAATMRDDEYRRLADDLNAFLAEGPMEGPPAGVAVKLATAAEQSNRPALAIEAYRELGKTLAASKDARTAGVGATMIGAARRLELVGKPFELRGATVANKPLDWKKYRGKVVLIEFFATWCGPCREEVPGILKCYKSYHKRGFDVIAVSVDRDRKAIEDYVEKEKLPWTILLDRSEARGTEKSMATYYGIFEIPEMILVGKDGKVVELETGGAELGKKLAELLGPAELNKANDRAAAADKAKRK